MKKAGMDITELTDAHARASEIVAAAARATAPRRTGNLANSIKSSKVKRTALVRVTAKYANPIHWGWPARNIDPNPWVSEAAQSTEAQWMPLYEAAVQDALDEVKGA
jgi:phage gpG-like protein